MDRVRVGIIGIGNIGSFHTQYLDAGEIQGAELSAVCDINPKRLEWAKSHTGETVRQFDNADDLIDSGLVDAVIISVPHYLHPQYAIKAFERGLHVMSEKPTGVYTKQIKQMNLIAEKSGLTFGVMFNQRTTPIFKKVRDLINDGELGELRRVNYTMSDCYRNQSYHNSASWRSTWKGEGGGVLLNQCVHNIDLWQGMCGVPVRIRGFCYFGKYREIETDDEVTAFAEYENGASGVFVCSTSESPGTNRIELVGDRGKIVVEDEKNLTFWRNRKTEKEFNKNATNGFDRPEVWKCEVPILEVQKAYNDGHKKIFQNFINNIMHGEPLIAPGVEGIRVNQIINAIYLSTWLDDWVGIPIDDDLFYAKLQEKIAASTFSKGEIKEQIQEDMKKTF